MEAMMAESNHEYTADPAARYLLDKARASNIETGWDRHEAMQEVCAFGDLGLCCRNCMMGPCRIDPFGEGPQKGICGITPDGMVARNLCRMVATGAAAHSDHGAHIFEVVSRIASGERLDFGIRDEAKLRRVAGGLGLRPNGGDPQQLLRGLVDKVRQTYSSFAGENEWMLRAVPASRLETLRNLRILPSSIDPVIRETMHRTHMGVDADPLNLVMAALKCGLADFVAMDVASNLSDILLGTPKLTFSRANVGVLDANAVNVAVHGHNPLISESLLQALPEFEARAQEAGAAKGLNIVGICCTGNEVLMRHGIPLATNAASQELAVLTGAVDAMVVDVQCVMPSLANVCECYHTALITTMSIARIPGANHVGFEPEKAKQCAHQILDVAIEAFKRRDRKKVDIPQVVQDTLVGFTPEAVISLLAKISPEDPLQALIDRIAGDEIHGIVLFAGCNNYRVPQDSSFLVLAQKLAADNVLMLATGCAAGAFAKRGYLSPRATPEICGDRLGKVLHDLGNVAGFGQPLPPIWHMGSCVDNSRVHQLAFALANKLGVDPSRLPVVASAPELMSEKAMAIGVGAVALGITTHLGVVPPILGGKGVTKILTETVKDLLGACFLIEPDPNLAYQRISETLTEKRLGLALR
jgi:carbon-monoxide dehydrogenase catalytic subunit